MTIGSPLVTIGLDDDVFFFYSFSLPFNLDFLLLEFGILADKGMTQENQLFGDEMIV